MILNKADIFGLNICIYFCIYPAEAKSPHSDWSPEFSSESFGLSFGGGAILGPPGGGGKIPKPPVLFFVRDDDSLPSFFCKDKKYCE